MRGCLRRKWPDHLSSGHLRTQSGEDVSGKSGWTTHGAGHPEVRIAEMSQAKMASPPELRASRTQSCEDVSGESGRTTHGARHLRGQNCEDVSGGNGLTTSAQGISEPRSATMSQAKVAGQTTMGQGVSEVSGARMSQAKVA